jgi:hypothetical protein
MTGYRQKLMGMEKIEKSNENLKKEYSKLISKVQEL